MKKKSIRIFLLSFILLALQGVAAPAPEKNDITMTDLMTRLYDFDGKVVEVEVTRASSFDQIGKGKYSAYMYYYKGIGSYNGEYVLIPEGGKELIAELADRDYGQYSTETIYMLVHCEEPIRIKSGDHTRTFKLEALGTKYKKSKGVYSW